MPALEVDLVARVLHLGEPADRVALRQCVAFLQVQDHAVVFGRVADAVDRGDGRHDHAVRSLENRLGGGKAHLLDVLVDRAVLLDVEVARGNVGFRLVVIVVRDEILDRVVGKELAELGIELRRERLVGGEHQRRAAGLRDHVRDREGLAGAGHAEERLEREAVGEPFDELRDRLRLVAGGLERLEELIGTVGIGDEHGVPVSESGGNCGQRRATEHFTAIRVAGSSPFAPPPLRTAMRPVANRADSRSAARRACPGPRGAPLPSRRSGRRGAPSRGDAR